MQTLPKRYEGEANVILTNLPASRNSQQLVEAVNLQFSGLSQGTTSVGMTLRCSELAAHLGQPVNHAGLIAVRAGTGAVMKVKVEDIEWSPPRDNNGRVFLNVRRYSELNGKITKPSPKVNLDFGITEEAPAEHVG